MTATEFKPDQFLAIYPAGIENHYWTLARNKIIKRELIRRGFANKKILDIGCGRGIVVNFLRHAGFDCWGVDLAEVKSDEGLNPYIKTGIDFALLDKNLAGKVEVVMLLDVIEHLENEVEFISRIKRFFPKLKRILITVPARSEIFSNYDLYNGHYRRYEFSRLVDLSKKCGWQMIGFSYFFHLLYLPAWLMFSGKIKRNTKISPPRGVMIFVHKVLAVFFVAEYLLLPKRLLGTSALCWFYD